MSQPDFNALAAAIEEALQQLIQAERVSASSELAEREAVAKLETAREAFDKAVREVRVRGPRGDPVPADDIGPAPVDTGGVTMPATQPRPPVFNSPRFIAGMPVAPTFNSSSRAEEDRVG